jgi:ATP-dependent Clp protease ATP-binding subunit ClpC
MGDPVDFVLQTDGNGETEAVGSDALSEDLQPIESFSKTAASVIEQAARLARQRGASAVTRDDLFASILDCSHCAAVGVLEALGFTMDTLIDDLRFVQGDLTAPSSDEPLSSSPLLVSAIEAAGREAARRGDESVQTTHLLAGLLRERSGLAAFILETPGVGFEPVGASLNRALRERVTDPD